MAKVRGGDRLAIELKKMAEKIRKANTVRVGFMEGATYPDGTSVPMVAAINEFGAPSKNIPPRPYFRGMIQKESKHWADDIAKILPSVGYDAKQALELMGQEIKGELQQSIRDLKTPANAKSTIKKKGFDDPLIDSSHMINSVDYEVNE